MNQMKRHVQHILQETQCDAEEREELEKELLSHLQDLKQYYLDKGESEKHAEKQAIAQFGGSKLIGRGLQESMYPWQRGLLYTIGIASLLFGVLFHLYTLFVLQEPSVGWLAIQLAAGAIVTLAAINIAFAGRHSFFLHVVVMFHLIWHAITYMFILGLPISQILLFLLYLIVLIGLELVFIFRNSYFSTPVPNADKRKRWEVKISYTLNIIFGMMVIAISLFFLWAFLLFGGWSMRAAIFPLIPVLLWFVFYKFQMKFIARKPLVSILTGLLFSALAVVVPFTVLSIS
jgi:hypothetical protein